MFQYPEIHLQSISSPKNGHFWNKLAITHKEFLSYARHLDILLFRSKENLPAFQRLLMRSYYDHVAVVIKDEMDRVFVLEAIESRGVWITPWSEILPTFKACYEDIGYRKLLIPETYLLNENLLEALLNRLIGQKYELSIQKLISVQESEKSDSGCPKPQPQNQEKTYFCSELVA